MIQIESVHIKEFRGIRELTLTMNCGNFVISGPNGSGKSGVVDAIQFALTGEIARLQGSGTGDLKLSEHGPHVDEQSHPETSKVTLNVYIPHLGKSASITRSIKKQKKPEITPKDDTIAAVFEEIAQHPEITFARREIIKFILTEATQRSRDVQTLLKLDDIDQTRTALKSAENKLKATYSTSKAQVQSAEEALNRHLNLPTFTSEDFLVAINTRRHLLSLSEIEGATVDTSVSAGLLETEKTEGTIQSKEAALRDLKVVSDGIAKGLETSTKNAVNSALQNISNIEADAELLASIKREPFLRSGFDLIDGPYCPLCDAEWEIEALRAHLQEKLEKSKEAQKVRSELLDSGKAISKQAIRLRGLIDPIAKLEETDEEFVKQLRHWEENLRAFAEALSTVEEIVLSKERLESGWTAAPESLGSNLETAVEKVKARPDKSAISEARDFLIVAQERWGNLQLARREAEKKRIGARRAEIAHTTYKDVAEAELESLYEEVEENFAEYYRLINQDDEMAFNAKLQSKEGKLGFLVDFHGKGMFPPGAYHSEGHQDGMGLCLYLALMKRVLGGNLTVAVLDDVVMSVDSQHRRKLCELLKTHFPDTQFIVTTHDGVWARQMRSAGLVGSKSAAEFRSWTVATGPVLGEVAGVWDQIDDDLAKNEVPTASGRLRRHLEYVATELAEEFAAKVPFKGDGGYDMNELLDAVIGRQGELLKQANKAANSWDSAEEKARVKELQEARTKILKARNDEQWIINKALHYNEWAADLSKEDFGPVVEIHRQLLGQFRCENPNCKSWIAPTDRQNPDDLRCDCGSFRLNLRQKP